ncbi:MAG TPA: hypothetical protein VK196_06125 [Magnetospirillum sp.]|nr:hypothetical protein [Magnetospirillum sp.]
MLQPPISPKRHAHHVTLCAQYLAACKPVMWRGTPLHSLMEDVRRWQQINNKLETHQTQITEKALLEAAEALDFAVTKEGSITFVNAVKPTGFGWAWRGAR